VTERIGGRLYRDFQFGRPEWAACYTRGEGLSTFSSCFVHRLENGRRDPFQREIGGNSLSSVAFLGHLSSLAPFLRQIPTVSRRRLPRRDRQGPDPLQHRPEQASGQMALGQQQPVVPGMFHQAPAGLDEALLHAGQRPAVDALRQHQAPPQVAQVVGEHAQLQADLVRPEPVTREPRPIRCLLALLDPLLGRASLVVKPRSTRCGMVPATDNDCASSAIRSST